MSNYKKILNEIDQAKKLAKERMITLILAGFGIVAALAWNDAIQTLFNFLFPKSQQIIGKFIYAVIITVVVVFISLQLQRVVKGDKS